MNEDEQFLDIDQIFGFFSDDSDNSILPILPHHRTVDLSGQLFSCPANHPHKSVHIDMNIKFDEKFPVQHTQYDIMGTTQIFVLPVRGEHYNKVIEDYSHDIVWRMLRGDTVKEIDDYIRLVLSDPKFREDNPPFRFRYVKVIISPISPHTRSTFLFC
jgi:hypothetical protein